MIKEHHWQQLSLVLISAAIFLTSLNSTNLWDQDEGFFASTAAEMHARGDWIVPVFNGELFGHKPPWMYWMMMLGYEFFGTTEFAARFFTGVFGVATCLLTYHLGRRLFNSSIGWWAGLILASGLMFSAASRAATPDTYLTFFVSLSLYLYVIWGPIGSRENQLSVSTEVEPDNRPSWRAYAIIYAVMGLATLVKGPIGFLFPMAIIGLYCLATTPVRHIEAAPAWRRTLENLRPFGPMNFLKTVWRMRIFTAIAMILLVAGPWFVAVGWKTNGAFLEEFFGVHHFRRFSTPMDSHKGSLLYYPISILVGMFPWSIFAIPTGILMFRRIREWRTDSPALLFVSCWAAVYVGIFSLASTKLPNYILPAYPALAIAAAYFFHHWVKEPEQVKAIWPRLAFFFLPFVGLGTAIALPIAGVWQHDGLTLLDHAGLSSGIQTNLLMASLIGIPAFLGGVAVCFLAEKKMSQHALNLYAATSVLTVLLLWNYSTPRIAQYQICGQIGSAIQEHAVENETEVATYGFFQPSLAFYVADDLIRIRGENDFQSLLESPESLIIVNEARLHELKERGLGRYSVLNEFERFPEKGKVLIIRPQQSDQRQVAEKDENPTRYQ